MEKRGAYFFVLDAIIAGAIFIITTVIVLGSYLNTPTTDQSYLLAEDTMKFMLNTKIKDFHDPQVLEWAENGDINNPEQSIFQQVAEFYFLNMDSHATNLTRIIIESLWPQQYGVSYSIIEETQNQTIYERYSERIPNSKFLQTSRKLTFFKINETSYFGPAISEVRIWG